MFANSASSFDLTFLSAILSIYLFIYFSYSGCIACVWMYPFPYTFCFLMKLSGLPIPSLLLSFTEKKNHPVFALKSNRM